MKPTLLITLLAIIFSQAEAQNLFVRMGATGNGTSWTDASGDLAGILKNAAPGTQIWVAKGTYQPTSNTNRNISFQILDGVQLYGGFAGTETSLEERDITANPTILSGEIGQLGLADNSFNVVYFHNAGTSTLLDGFVITAGNANSDNNEEGTIGRCGAGLYVNGENGASCSPIIRNCVFTENHARDGAAVYINGRNGEANPQFDNCTFKFNEAGLDGGAIYNDGRLNGKSNLILTNCTFEKNMGTYGGAICNATESGICNLTLENCNFIENAAYLRGGAVFSLNGDEKCYLEISSCNFQGNYPDDQNMIFTSNTARANAYKVSTTAP